MNGFLCFNALQRWLSACAALIMLIRSLNYTFNRDTHHSHDDEINCNCIWQCFINIYCLSNRPKNTFFRASVLFKCYDLNTRVWAFPFVKFSDYARNRRIIISHKLAFNTDIHIGWDKTRTQKRQEYCCLLVNDSLDVWVHWGFVRHSWWLIDCLSVMSYDLRPK